MKRELKQSQDQEGLEPLPSEERDFNLILRIYGLRWRIETIFKTWKSHLSFNRLHRVSEVELKPLLIV